MITEVGKKVQEFYNEIPFPDYDINKFNSKEDLKIISYPFAKILDRSIPADAAVIDVGTGTGQLSALLSLRRKSVYGIDFSDSSLNKAEKLKRKLKLSTWHLKKIDILDEKQMESLGKFDYVLCLGVLHHTGNAHRGFENIIKLLKPGGYVAVGLYHKVGRIPLKIRKFLSRTIFKNNQKIKDHFIKLQIGNFEDKERARGWWHDQYMHVHETSHSLGEVLKWFKENNVEYYQTIPSSTPFDKTDLEIAGIWGSKKEIYPFFPIRMYKQLTWLWKTQKEGGYWITCGRLKSNKD